MNAKQFVIVRSGEIITAVYSKDGRFWLAKEMRKNGQPDLRYIGRPCQITANPDGYPTGRYAPVILEREAQAEPMRRKIMQLRDEANKLERELVELYCLPSETPNP